ncbi:MAG: hypothetical protein SFY69_06340 [Planctomycetota bacterium]|nr:hypothetical protein [Planctomycetota bacterium]
MKDVRVIHPDGTTTRAVTDSSVEHVLPETTMPGTPEEAASEIREVSPEGRPGDAKTGPGGIMLWMAAALVFVIVVSVVVGWWVDWPVGAMVFAIGTIGLLSNPSIYAAASRAKERGAVIRQHRHDHPPR